MRTSLAVIPHGSLVRLLDRANPRGHGERTYRLERRRGLVRGLARDGASVELDNHSDVWLELWAPHVARYAMLGADGHGERVVVYAGRTFMPSDTTLWELKRVHDAGHEAPQDLLDALLVADGLVPWCEAHALADAGGWRTLNFAEVAARLEGEGEGRWEPGTVEGPLFRGQVLADGAYAYRGNAYRSASAEGAPGSGVTPDPTEKANSKAKARGRSRSAN